MKIKQRLLAASIGLIIGTSSYAATYEVREIDTSDLALSAFASSIGEDGQVSLFITGVLSNTSVQYPPANPPLDATLIDFTEALNLILEDPEAAMQGDFTEADYITLLQGVVLTDIFGDQTQRIGRFESFIGDENGITRVPVFDQIDPDLGELSRSVSSLINKTSSIDRFVGEAGAPYTKEVFINEDGDSELFVVREFVERGYAVIDDQLIPLPSAIEQGGGWSQAIDMNNNLTVVGSVASEILTTFQVDFDNCVDPENENDAPVNSCITDLLDNVSTRNTTGFPNVLDIGEESLLFNIRGAVWQLSESGEIQSFTTLEPIREVEAETEFFIPISRASAINNNGTVIGQSIDEIADVNQFVSYAVVYDQNGIPSHITDNSDDSLFGSSAADINDNNIIVGTELRNVGGVGVNVFFVHDLDAGETINPQLFFDQSDTLVTDINNQGLVVGDTQIEFATNGRQLRRSGFLYDVNDETVFNLNDLDSCESPYNIINAEAINEAGEIAATALIERQVRDPITLELGVDDAGDPITEEVTVAVKLVPIPGGEIEDCTGLGNNVTGVEGPLERQGAGLFYLLIGLLGGVFLKRRLNK